MVPSGYILDEALHVLVPSPDAARGTRGPRYLNQGEMFLAARLVMACAGS